MIHHHHDHTGLLGAISGTLGYFVGIEAGYIPEPHHYWSAIITAASTAFVGWAVTKISSFLWNRIWHRIKQIKWVSKQKK